MLAPGALAGANLLVGAADDGAKSVDPLDAKAKLDLARLAGLDTVRLTTIWAPGRRAPAARELEALKNASTAADLNGMRIVLSVYQRGSRTTPRTKAQRAQFARFTASIVRAVPGIRHVIVGNEPNLNRFWMPQFTRAGKPASPAAYMALLAPTYDALKGVSRKVTVIGGALAPRGGDNPRSTRHTQSPTRFLEALGRAYRASKRKRPIMDALAIHPYGIDSSRPPETRNPRNRNIGLNDYGKLVATLRRAFAGTRQPGAKLPIYYTEYGIQSRVPGDKADLYEGREPATTKPVDERTQGDFYRRALLIARCQPTVRALLFFLVTDEANLDRWQSGLLYPDGSPKTSMAVVQTAATATRTMAIGPAFCRSVFKPKPPPKPAATTVTTPPTAPGPTTNPTPPPPPPPTTPPDGSTTPPPPPPAEPPPVAPPPAEPPPVAAPPEPPPPAEPPPPPPPAP